MSARECFSRASAHKWFVVIVIALMVGQEHVGVTSIIRELWIHPVHYYAALHFFRSTAWKASDISRWWVGVLIKTGVLYHENGMPIIIGDGTQKSKEGKKMPCVKRLHQSSENSAKPTYIYGHMFGMIGVLAGNIGKLFCIPIPMKIHDGDKEILKWDSEPKEAKIESHVVRTIRDAGQAAKQLGRCLLLLDAYYLTIPALVALSEEGLAAGGELLSIVVRAKSNATAYRLPTRKPGRGRPPIRGEKVSLMDLWNNNASMRSSMNVVMYGEEKAVSYLTYDFLWGNGHYQMLRFVIAQVYGSKPIILASTDLTLLPEQILRLYSYRFKIECCFFNMKHTIAGFAYRFWSVAMPKLNRYAKSGTDALEAVSDSRDKKLIAAAFRATHAYVMTACVAIGLLHVCALLCADEINASPLRWLRTKTNVIPSEASTADFLRKTIFKHLGVSSSFAIIQLIQSLHGECEGSLDSLVA